MTHCHGCQPHSRSVGKWHIIPICRHSRKGNGVLKLAQANRGRERYNGFDAALREACRFYPVRTSCDLEFRYFECALRSLQLKIHPRGWRFDTWPSLSSSSNSCQARLGYRQGSRPEFLTSKARWVLFANPTNEPLFIRSGLNLNQSELKTAYLNKQPSRNTASRDPCFDQI